MRKNIIKLMLIAGIAFTTFAVNAQGPPQPPGSGHGQTGNQAPGGGAPIGSGLAILLALGVGYGGKKLYDARKKTDE